MLAVYYPAVGPVCKKRKTAESPDAETSPATVKRKGQRNSRHSRPRSKAEVHFEQSSRYLGEPNCLMVPSSAAHGAITITFDPMHNATTFAYTEDFLTKEFAYFKAALSTLSGVPKFVEGDSKHFQFDNITSQAFARILIYIERKRRLGRKYGENFHYRAEPVHDLLQAVIAADYLCMRDFRHFEAYIAERLAFALVMGRLNLTPAVLLLVTEHVAFRSGLLWDVCVKAAVRVRLQAHKDKKTNNLYNWEHEDAYTADEHLDCCSWEEIRAHYAEMEKLFPWYSDAVRQAVHQTLVLREKVADRYHATTFHTYCEDPLFEYTRSIWVVSPRRIFLQNPYTHEK